MNDPVDEIAAHVGHHPGMSSAEVRSRVAHAVSQRLPLASADRRNAIGAAVLDRLNGTGPIERLLDDATVDEVIIHAGLELWVERSGALERLGRVAPGDVERFLERSLAPIGRRLDRSSPTVDARLSDGSRLCAVIHPIAVAGTEISLRRHREGRLTIDDFAPPAIATVIRAALEQRCNIVVTGATSSGKTSLLTCLVADRLAAGERIVLLEDTAEIVAPGHLVRLETRPPNADGTTAIGLDDLLVTALRMRPDRLVVGEIRGSEVVTLVEAMNTGHDGSMATCHANGPVDAMHRLAQLVLRAAPGWPMAAIHDQLHRSIDLVIHLGRGAGGRRHVTSIAEPDGDGMRPITDDTRRIAKPRRSRCP